MYLRTLKQMRDCIRTKRYVMTLHAEEEMVDDDLTVFDIEHVIMTGEIVERQEDDYSGEWKYLVRGLSENNESYVIVVNKISVMKKMIIITVFKE